MTSKFMKQVVAVLSTVAVCAISAQAATPPGMKMTTGIPEGIATQDKLETRIGTLTSFDGVPDEETTRLVWDNLDFQRAVQAYLNSIRGRDIFKSMQWMPAFAGMTN